MINDTSFCILFIYLNSNTFHMMNDTFFYILFIYLNSNTFHMMNDTFFYILFIYLNSNTFHMINDTSFCIFFYSNTFHQKSNQIKCMCIITSDLLLVLYMSSSIIFEIP